MKITFEQACELANDASACMMETGMGIISVDEGGNGDTICCNGENESWEFDKSNDYEVEDNMLIVKDPLHIWMPKGYINLPLYKRMEIIIK